MAERKRTAERCECPACGQSVALSPTSGRMRPHGPRDAPCLGSQLTPAKTLAELTQLPMVWWRDCVCNPSHCCPECSMCGELSGLPCPRDEDFGDLRAAQTAILHQLLEERGEGPAGRQVVTETAIREEISMLGDFSDEPEPESEPPTPTIGPLQARFNPERHAVYDPSGSYCYQLIVDEAVAGPVLFGVWSKDRDGSWLFQMMVQVDSDLDPVRVMLPLPGPPDPPDPEGSMTRKQFEVLMQAFGHIWAAHQFGLWHDPAEARDD